ncbi:hypothetical protein WKW77_30625 [Variovorax ureilyticus]|uniref:Uncharacterized protein n=1 Tax=Variovorax ureilyticus TaxID=1836198 RepID=A0ABU8VP70_9BURK
MSHTANEIEAIGRYNREAQARTRARTLGLDPEQLNFDPNQCPCFSPSGLAKSIESTAVMRLLEARWHEQQTSTGGAKKTKKGVAA